MILERYKYVVYQITLRVVLLPSFSAITSRTIPQNSILSRIICVPSHLLVML